MRRIESFEVLAPMERIYSNLCQIHLKTCFQVNQNLRASRGGSGALYSQSAIVRVMLAFDAGLDGLPFGSGVEVWVLRNMSL